MTKIKVGLERELLVTRESDNVSNSKWVDSDFNMVGIKKGGNKVSSETFITDMEKRGLVISWSDNYRKGAM